jgi:hypothetical protein
MSLLDLILLLLLFNVVRTQVILVVKIQISEVALAAGHEQHHSCSIGIDPLHQILPAAILQRPIFVIVRECDHPIENDWYLEERRFSRG